MFGMNGSNDDLPAGKFVNKAVRWIAVGSVVVFGGRDFFQKCKEFIKERVMPRTESNVSVNPNEIPQDTIFIDEDILNEMGNHYENGTYDGFPLKKYGEDGKKYLLTGVKERVEYVPSPNDVTVVSKGNIMVGKNATEIERFGKTPIYVPMDSADAYENLELVDINVQERGPVVDRGKRSWVVEVNSPKEYGPEGASGGKQIKEESVKTVIGVDKTTFTYTVVGRGGR